MPTKERTSPEQDFNTFRPMFDRLLAGKTATEVIQIEADGEEIKQKQRIQHAKRVLRAWHWVLSQGLDGFPSEEGKPGFEDYFRQRSAIAFTITPETGDLILYLRDGATEPLHSAIGSGINFLKQGLSVAQAAEKSGHWVPRNAPQGRYV